MQNYIHSHYSRAFKVFLQNTKLNYISQPSLQPGRISSEFWPGILVGVIVLLKGLTLRNISWLSPPSLCYLLGSLTGHMGQGYSALQCGFMGRGGSGLYVVWMCRELRVCTTLPCLYCAKNGVQGFMHAREVSYQLSGSPSLVSGLLRPFSLTRKQRPASDLGCGIVVDSGLCIYDEVNCSSPMSCEV